MARLMRLLASVRRDDGSAMVEMAVSATILIAMFIGSMQVMVAMYIYQYTSDAARQATRWAMVRGDTSCTNTPNLDKCNATLAQVQDYVKTLKFPGIRTSKVVVTPQWCVASGTTPPISWSSCSQASAHSPGNEVQVTVAYPIAFQIPFSTNLSFTVSSTSQMVITQ
jgi:Flp pilus assembly protein TadG